MSTDIKQVFKDNLMLVDKERLADLVADLMVINFAPLVSIGRINELRNAVCMQQQINPAILQTARQSQNTIDCDKKQALTFYEHLLDLVEKERMSKNYSEWCELEREYIALIGEKHFKNKEQQWKQRNAKSADVSCR